MKNILMLLLATVLLASCGSQNKDEKAPSRDPDQKAPPKDTVTHTVPDTQPPVSTESKPVLLSEDDFYEIVGDLTSAGKWKFFGDKPCMVDFYADWCGPCRTIAPYIDEFAKKYQGQINVYKVNTDYAKDLSRKFKITGIPAVMFCPMKGQYQMMVGASPKEQYEEMITSLLLAK